MLPHVLVSLKAGRAEVMLSGPSALGAVHGARDALQLVRGPGSVRSCCLLGFTAVYIETWLGRGLVARCQPQLAWPSRSSPLLPLPPCFKVTFPGQT